MVLIPNDVGIRMRMQTEAALQPLAPVTEIPADLVELHPGQTFSARIQEVLPENTYKALVAGRSLTLALPQGANTGDTLELVVVDRTPRLVIAQLAKPGSGGDAAAESGAQLPSLSPTARMIGALLARDGAAPPPAALTRGQPLLPAALTDPAALAAELAPRLARAVGQSGLFYEAHQVQWVMGQRPLTDLLVEPQGRHSSARTLPANAEESAGLAARTPPAGRRAEAPAPPGMLQNVPTGDEARPRTPAEAPTSPAQAVPEDLRPLVQQQLDAAATQRMAWHGEVWPGQSMEWRVEPDDRHAEGEQPGAERGWVTSLRLVTPRLGAIDARLGLTAEGVRISLAAPTGASAADLLDAAPLLAKSMSAAGVPLLALQVKHAAADE